MKRTIQKKFMSLIIAVAMVISLMPLGTLAAVTTSGNWTDSGNYTTVTEGNLTISTETQLAGFAVAVNGGADFSGYTVTLANDLSLAAHYWTPIGDASDTSGTNFRGIFNGAGHTISNLMIGTAASPAVLGNAGLFGYVYCGSITDIGVLNVSIYTSGNAGGLVGTFNGTNGVATPVTKSYVTGSVSANGDYAGGLIGNAGYCGVSKCYAVVSVTGGDATMAGGLLGQGGSPGSAASCYATGSVTSGTCAGGLIGVLSGMQTNNCYAAGSTSSTSFAGGLIGYLDSGTVTGCYYNSSAGTATGTGSGTDDAISKTSAQMKETGVSGFAATLGSAIWKDDIGNKNGGYPILDGIGVGNITDATAPVLSSTSASSITSSGVTLNFTSDEAGTYYYLVYAAADSAPDAATIKAQGTAAATGTGAATASANAAAVSGLSGGTAYKAYVIVEDAAGNKSAVSTITFTTMTKLVTPTSLAWDTTTPGKATWNAVTGASSYSVQLYKGGIALGSAVSVTTLYNDLTSAIEAAGNGTYTFKVTAKGDGINYSDSDVSAVSSGYVYNTAPSFAGSTEALTVDEGSSGNSVKNVLHVSDVDSGQMLTWTEQTAPSHGTLTITGATATSGTSDITPGGTIEYAPTAGYHGSDSFTIQVSDGTATAARTITVTVTAVPDKLAAPAGLAWDTAIPGKATWNTVTGASGYSVQLYKGGIALGSAVSVTTLYNDFTSAIEAAGNGTYMFRVTAKGDGINYSDSDVSAVSNGYVYNTTPSFVGSTEALTVDESSSGNSVKDVLHVSDIDSGQTLTWTEQTAPSHGTLTIAGATAASGTSDITPAGTITYTPTAGYHGSDGFTIQVSDGTATATRTITVTVTTVLTKLVTPTSLAWDTTTPGKATWNVVTGASSYSVQLYKGGIALGSAVSVTTLYNDFTSAIEAAGNGTYTFKVTAKGDGINYSDSDVSAVSSGYVYNTTPSFVGSTTSLTVDKNSNGNSVINMLHVSDVDSGQTLTWTEKTAPSHGTLTITGATAASGTSDITPAGTTTYTPTAGYSGSDSFAIQVSDGTATATRTITVTVKAAIIKLIAPTGLAWDTTTPGKATWNADIGASGYSVQLYKGGIAQGIAVSVTTLYNDFSSTIEASGNGTYTFRVTAKGDGINYSGSDVSAVSSGYVYNTAPSFVGSTEALTVDESSSGNSVKNMLHVSDVDSGQMLTWTEQTAPSHGTLTITGATATSGTSDITPGGTTTYTPTAGYSGSDSFTIQVSDGTATATRTITVTVTAAITTTPALTGTADIAGSVTSAATTAVKKTYDASAVAPVLSSKTQTTVTLTSVTGYEYVRVSNGADVSTGTWQDSNVFSGLLSGTEYDFYQRIKETTTYKASAISGKLDVVTEALPEPTPTTKPDPTTTPTTTPTATPATKTSAETAAAGTRTITGTLLDSNDNPMAGYVVELHSDPITTITDANGQYTFHNVDYTSHELIVKTAEGEKIAEFELAFSEGKEFSTVMTKEGVNITYTLSTETVNIEIKMTPDQSGAAISRVSGSKIPQTSNSLGGFGSVLWWVGGGALALMLITLLIIVLLKKKRKI